jgi:hypothetical protein
MTDRQQRYEADMAPGRYDVEPGPTTRGRSMPSPGLIFLVIAIIGSIVYMVFVISVRDSSQIPLMASGAVVLAIVFAALSIYSLRTVLRAGLEPNGGGRAMLVALVGGVAAIAAAGFVAGAIILFQIGSWKPA